jgi:outer membrane lipoprotein
MKLKHPLIHAGWLVLVLSITACSTHIPSEIRQPLEGSPGVGEVRANADAFVSRKVRWGGVILGTENRQDASRLTIVAFPLSDDGEPRVSDQSSGRFIAIVDEFMEPTVYSSDREITVTGRVLKTETLKVGDFAYEYPVIQVEQYHLWPEKTDPVYVDYPPYWWYDPWYPYYPYYPHHHHHRD